MKKKFKLGIIGSGNMAYAIVQGAVEGGFLRPKKIICSDHDEEKLDAIGEFGVYTTTDSRDVIENSEYVLLAVKPQSLAQLSEEVKGCKVEKIISIMAGVTVEKIKDSFDGEPKVARVMPNLGSKVKHGTAGVYVAEFNDDVDSCDFVFNLFRTSGGTLNIKSEDMLSAVTGISGSGIAYIYRVMKAMIDSGIKLGFSEEESRTLVTSTVMGAAFMSESEEATPISELISNVCSKGGTTIEAINSLESDDIDGMFDRAIQACVKRAKELSL